MDSVYYESAAFVLLLLAIIGAGACFGLMVVYGRRELAAWRMRRIVRRRLDRMLSSQL
jgi:hypothetical protein